MKNKKILLSSAVLFFTVLFLIGWYVLAVPRLLSFSQKYQFSSEIKSSDNFYNEDIEQFNGAERTAGFINRVAEKNADSVFIDSRFIVKTLNGEDIADFDKKYGIDPRTYIAKSDMSDEEIFIVPPPLMSKDTFLYEHINYDVAIPLQFVEEEVILGVNTYKFKADFSNAQIDQTNALASLPDVPELRGVVVEPELEIWFEPISGSLIKYQDEAIAYFYDQKTKEKIAPWNSFKNFFEKSSVALNIENAKNARFHVLLIILYIPLIVANILIFFALFVLSKKWSIAAIIPLLLLALLSFFIFSDKSTNKKSIYFSDWVSDQDEFNETYAGFLEGLSSKQYFEDDLSIEKRTADLDIEKQRSIAQEIKNTQPDLVFSLTTPGTKEILNKIDDVPIVFSIVTYPVEAGIVSSLNNTGGNITGTRNWVEAKSQIDTFLSINAQAQKIGFVHRKDEPNSEIQYEEFRKYANQLNLEIVKISATDIEDLPKVLENAALQIDSIYSACDTLIQGSGSEVVRDFARKNSLPDFSCGKYDVLRGALVSEVADFYEIGRIAGEQAGDILDGFPPSALPVQASSKSVLYINETRARELGLIIPDSLLNKAELVVR
jgi:putative ABC transport system substrate-binding protein